MPVAAAGMTGACVEPPRSPLRLLEVALPEVVDGAAGCGAGRGRAGLATQVAGV